MLFVPLRFRLHDDGSSVFFGWVPSEQPVDEPTLDIPQACDDRGRSAWYRVCPERKLLPEPVASMESRSVVRHRDKSR